MANSLEELPTELLHLILQSLQLSDLVTFARTSKSNYQLANQTLTKLDLAVFPRRIHSLLSFFVTNDLDEEEDEDEDNSDEPPLSIYWARNYECNKSLYQIGLISPNQTRSSRSRSSTPPTQLTGSQRKALHRNLCSPSPPRTALSVRTTEITNQNTLAASVLSTPSLTNLRTLTLRLYDLSSPDLARAIASLSNLRALALEFSHPYIHDTTLPAKYWKETVAAGSPVWNHLAGVGPEQSSNLKLHSLRSLKLMRSGITSFQLRHWIEANPELQELKLGFCRGVDKEFLTWLADHESRKLTERQSVKLEAIKLIDCAFLELTTESDMSLVTQLTQPHSVLKELSFRGCKGVDEETLLRTARGSNDKQSSIFTSTNALQKLVSPKAIVLKRPHPTTNSTSCAVRERRLGNVSPALTISEGMMGSNGSSSSSSGGIAGVGGSYFGKIDVDPKMAR